MKPTRVSWVIANGSPATLNCPASQRRVSGALIPAGIAAVVAAGPVYHRLAMSRGGDHGNNGDDPRIAPRADSNSNAKSTV